MDVLTLDGIAGHTSWRVVFSNDRRTAHAKGVSEAAAPILPAVEVLANNDVLFMLIPMRISLI
jgi:hypothetical protein